MTRVARRRIPLLQWFLLLTCLILSGIITAQQQVIAKQGALIQLISGDSSELAALKVQQIIQHNAK